MIYEIYDGPWAVGKIMFLTISCAGPSPRDPEDLRRFDGAAAWRSQGAGTWRGGFHCKDVGKSWEIIGTYGKILGKATKIMGKSGENQNIWENLTRNGAFEWWMFQLATCDYRFFLQPQSHRKLDTWKSWRKYHRKELPSWFHTFQQLFGDPYIPNGIRW